MNALNALKASTVTAVQTEEQRPPRIYWRNGAKQARTPGFFYVKEDELSSVPAGAWQYRNLYDDEGGYQAAMLAIAPIMLRSQPFRIEGSDRDARTIWLTAYEPGAKIYTEILCFAEGIDEPVVLCAKGMTGKALTGKSGILNQYKHGLLREASRLAGKALNTWAFWLPIASAVDSKGQILYEDTGFKSFTTPPALTWPAGGPAAMEDLIEAQFVGAELYARGADVYSDFLAWRDQRRGNAAPEPIAAPAPAADGPWDDSEELAF